MSKRYRAKRGQRVPIPAQPNQYVPDEGDGIPVSETLPYWARLIADGDLVLVQEEAPEAKKPARKPRTKKPKAQPEEATVVETGAADAVEVGTVEQPADMLIAPQTNEDR